jgi:DnaJ family protein C protein 7
MASGVLDRQSQAEALKDKGNEAFKSGKYDAAVEYYTDASRLVPSCPIYISNRAMAYLKLEKYA